MTTAQLSTFMAIRIQKKSARRYVAITIKNTICSAMPTDTATTRWNTSFDRFRTCFPPFAAFSTWYCLGAEMSTAFTRKKGPHFCGPGS